jgi:hypothetical protein
MEHESRSSILETLHQFRDQYKVEVPGNRQAWPASVKELICKLFDSGMTASEISREIQISYYTVNTWVRGRRSLKRIPKATQFIEARVVQPKPFQLKRGRPRRIDESAQELATVTVKEASKLEPAKAMPPVTVTVTTPTGFKIENLPVEIALSIIGVRR